jgi:SprT protein
MAKKEVPLHGLQSFLPPGALPWVLPYLEKYQVHLTITRERKSVLGDYRHALPGKNHRISVNGNLNPYAFLITLIHELAHLICFQQFAHRVAPHGAEWKHIYRLLLSEFLGKQLFPDPVEHALMQSLHNLPVSSCGDVKLARVLQQYDVLPADSVRVEELKDGAIFKLEKRYFRREEKLRKRIRCTDCKSGRGYLFSPVASVEKLSDEVQLKWLLDMKLRGL